MFEPQTCFGLVEREALLEDAQPGEQRVLVRVQKVEAPLDRRGQRPLPLRYTGPRSRQDVETFVEPSDQLRGREHADPRRGQLEREGNAFESATELEDGRPVVVVEHEVVAHASRPFDEQLDGGASEGPTSSLPTGTASGGTGYVLFGSQANRRATRDEHGEIGALLEQRRRAPAAAPSTCSKLSSSEQHAPTTDRGGQYRIRAAPMPRWSRPSPRRWPAARRRRTLAPSRRTITAPSTNRDATDRANSSPSRVLPIPPGPTSVTRRMSSSTRRSRARTAPGHGRRSARPAGAGEHPTPSRREWRLSSGSRNRSLKQHGEVLGDQALDLVDVLEPLVGHGVVRLDAVDQLLKPRLALGCRVLQIDEARQRTGQQVFVLEPRDRLVGCDPAVALPVDAEEDVSSGRGRRDRGPGPGGAGRRARTSRA